MQPTVFVLDDHEALREGLRCLMESVNLPVATFSSAEEFIAHCVPAPPGCLIVDVRLPGMSGLDLQLELRRRGSRIPIIILTGHADVPMAVRAMKAGAFDFIEKPVNDQVLLDRVRVAIEQDRQIREHEERIAELKARAALLTPREREVMALVVDGNANKEAATKLKLSQKTIEVHRAHVMKKLNVGSLAELVRVAILLTQSASLA